MPWGRAELSAFGGICLADRSLLEPPPASHRARFAPGFGKRVLLTVDTEEEFDWSKPFRSSGHGLGHILRIVKFQEFCEGMGVVPVYLVDWPVATSAQAREILGPLVRDKKAEIGIQLHPWVNPPHREEISAPNSFAGNLPPDLEREKFGRLADAIEEGFGCVPRIYRAGRYGVGHQTARMLKDRGIAIDSSVRTHHDYRAQSGPDFSNHPEYPYWTDEDRKLLELPLTTCYWGMLRRQGALMLPLLRRFPRLGGALTRMGMFERIPLTPEGTSKEEAIRCIDMALDDGMELLVVSLHSPSLMPGHTPYVQSEDDLDALYDWLRGAYGYFLLRGVKPVTVEEIIDSVAV